MDPRGQFSHLSLKATSRESHEDSSDTQPSSSASPLKKSKPLPKSSTLSEAPASTTSSASPSKELKSPANSSNSSGDSTSSSPKNNNFDIPTGKPQPPQLQQEVDSLAYPELKDLPDTATRTAKHISSMRQLRKLALRDGKALTGLGLGTWKLEASLGYTRGEEAAQACSICSPNPRKGPFKQCIIVKNEFGGACCNCHYCSEGISCSLHRHYTKDSALPRSPLPPKYPAYPELTNLPDTTTRVAKILVKMPEKRELAFYNSKTLSGLKKFAPNLEASLGYTRGDEAVQVCENCSKIGKRLGPFPRCVVVTKMFKGACCNCHYSAKAMNCSFRSLNTAAMASETGKLDKVQGSSSGPDDGGQGGDP